LITKGPHRYPHHPAYLGQPVLLLGVGIAVADAWAIPAVVLPALSALVLRIIIEERALERRFGKEWTAYRKSTWRLIPLVW